MAILTNQAGTWTLDPSHTRLGFSARHAMVTKVRGGFNEFTGTVVADGENSKVDVTVQTASIDTRNADRDGHLRTNDFFDPEKYPEIKFSSTSIKEISDGLEITGDLTIKDVTKSVTIPFEFAGVATDPFGNERAGFEGSIQINRTDWNLNWNSPLDTGGVLVSEKVTLEFEVSAIKQS